MAQTKYCELVDTEDLLEEMVGWRRAFHRNPEIGFEEHETAKFIASLLREWGFDVAEGIGGTGVVGTLRNGPPLSPRIGIRADMDALPIQESSALPYTSASPGKMHACGHDGHTAMLLGAAKQLARSKRFSGTVHVIFQPAEEVGENSGASAMIRDGLFRKFPCDAIFAMHNHPGLRSGAFLFRSGPFMAASDTVTLEINGLGGHAARPHLATDAIVTAAATVMALQTIISRNIDPAQPAVVTIGSFLSGTAPNIIADKAVLKLSVRSFDAAVRRQMRERIEAVAKSQAMSFGASVDISYTEGYPVLRNSHAETILAATVAAELVGSGNVNSEADLQMGSEDFSYMLNETPGCFVRLGNGVGYLARPLHSSNYDFNDKNLTLGAAYWTRLVERFCAQSDCSSRV